MQRPSHHASRLPTAAFTLIEVMVALGLAVVIILVAAQAFSAISKTVTVINRLNQENQLLRAGFWAALQNADFWDGEASPEAPYYRMHNRHARTKVLTAACATRVSAVFGSNDGSCDRRKRFLAPVVFSARASGSAFLSKKESDINVSQATNPDGSTPATCAFLPIQPVSTFLPHDPRSWYRNGPLAPAKPGAAVAKSQAGSAPGAYNKTYQSIGVSLPDWVSPRLLLGDYGLHQATDMSDANAVAGRFRPVDWDGSSVTGDDTNGNGDLGDDADDLLNLHEAWFSPGSDPVGRPSSIDVFSSRPRAFWQMFQRLGHFGTALYLPNGMPFTIVDQRGLWPRHDSAPTYRGWNGSNWFTDAMQTFNAYLGMKEGGGTNLLWQDNDDEPFACYAVQSGASDWQTVLGVGNGGSKNGAMVVRPNRFPVKMSQINQDFHSRNKLRFDKDAFFTASPFVGRSGTLDLTGDDGSQGAVIRVLRHPNLTAEVTLLPFNVCDSWHESIPDKATWWSGGLDGDTQTRAWDLDDLPTEIARKTGVDAGVLRTLLRRGDTTGRPAGAPLLRMQMLRLQMFDGGQLAVFHVQIEDPEVGRMTTLRLAPLGTSYRGARQHWACRHRLNGGDYNRNDVQGNAPIGDFHVYP